MMKKSLGKKSTAKVLALVLALVAITFPMSIFADDAKEDTTTDISEEAKKEDTSKDNKEEATKDTEADTGEEAIKDKAWENPFSDLNESNWFYNSVAYVVQNEVFSGKTETLFAPNEKMTRGMFVTVLGRYSEEDPNLFVSSEALSFSDVKETFYYLPYIEWASKQKITSGIGNYKFEPDRAITREEMAVIMINYAKAMNINLPNNVEVNEFNDEDEISSWAKESVNIMKQVELITGNESGDFAPKESATRAEVAVIIERFENIDKE